MSGSKLFARLAAMLVFCGSMLHSGGAYAQAAADQNSDRLEEIVVTAQKRTENLQEVPISADVINRQTLTEQNDNSLADLTQTLPAVHIYNAGVQSNSLSIRGIGSGTNSSFDQSVAIFDDDIYYGRSRTSGATFLDLDRIEVLKGPQSTFFGNNAIAGALNIVSAKPGDAFEGWARALYGSYDQYALEGAAGGPISDQLGIRVAATLNGGAGWIKNVDTGQYGPDINNKAARLTAVFKPVEDLDATLKVEGSQHQTLHSASDEPGQYTNCPPPPPFPASALGTGGACAAALAMSVPTGLANNENTGLPGQFNSLSTFDSVLTLNYHQWGHTFTSVTGFDSYHYNEAFDYVGLPTEYVGTTLFPEAYHQWSQELRVASPVGGPIEYLAGAYFQTDRLYRAQETNLPLFDFAASIPGLTSLASYLPLAYDGSYSQHEDVYSAFGSLGWNVTDSLKLKAGFRYSDVTKDISIPTQYGTGTSLYGGFVPMPLPLQQLASAVFIVPPGTQSLSRSDHDAMPSAQLQYQLARDAMAYFTFARGFKAGGFNGESLLRPLVDEAFGPEHVNAYELGLKSKWFDDRLLLNLDVFLSDYRDLQVSTDVINPATNTYIGVVTNAAASRSQGVELETQWVATRALRLSANVTYLDAYYVSFPNAPPSTLQNVCAGLSAAQFSSTPQCAAFPYPVPSVANLAGQPTNYAPKWSGAVTANYSAALPGQYLLMAEVSPYFTSRYTDGSGDSLYSVGGYVRLDARLTLQSPQGRWALDVIGKNLTDRVIPTSILGATGYKEEPLNVAGQIRYRW